jgi:hypothetical protein
MLPIIAGVLILNSGIVSSMSAARPEERSAPPQGGFVVHEWGTFTTFAGADGTPRQFTTRIGEKLPSFIYTRPRQAGDEEGHKIALIGKFDRESLVRMETPVIYFYTDSPRTVDVDVKMPDGLITEFYPPVTRMEPEYRGPGYDALSGCRMTWNRLALIPDPAVHPGSDSRAPEPPQLPAIEGESQYAAARNTDAAYVRFEGPGGAVGGHNEKFIFYRGLGGFNPPIKVKALGEDRFTLVSAQPERVSGAFVLAVESGRLRFASYTGCTSEQEMQLPSEFSTGDSLAGAVAKSLVASGLYEKEATAMVETWRSSWFAEEGTRVLYILPERVTDQILPLVVTPKPNDQRRVFVGRAEVLTPETQKRIESVLLATEDNQFAEVWGDREVRRLGRFTSAALARIAEAPLNKRAGAKAGKMLGR